MDIFEQVAPLVRGPSPLAQGQRVPGGRLVEEALVDDAHLYPNLFESCEEDEKLPATAEPQSQAATTPLPPPSADRLRAYATFHALATDVARRTSPAAYQQLQKALSTQPRMSIDELRKLAAAVGGVSEASIVHLRDAALAAGMLPGVPAPSASALPTAAAVFAAHKRGAALAPLPRATSELFRRDAHDHVLWYAAPPLGGVRGDVLDATTPLTLPSLDYLYAQAAANK